MKTTMPFFYTSPHAIVKEEVGFDNENGVIYQENGGEHCIWAARVPFLPALMSEDFTRMGVKRIALIQQRQFRFIYDLVRARENRATFELRFISTPNPVPGQPNLIDIIFLGKVFSRRNHGAQPLAERLWEKFLSNFPLEDPYGYPLEPVTDKQEFMCVYQPLAFEEILAKNVMEIRKYEDMPIKPTAALGRVERKGDYIAHPFVPSEDFNPMGRFFVALAAQPQKCYAGISIRPTRMFDQEVFNVSFMIGQFKKTASEDDDITEEYIRTRSKIGIYVYKQLMASREQLVTVRVSLVGENEAPHGLAEALGSEMMGNAENTYPTMWTAAVPADENEMASVLNNLQFLEQDTWGHTIAPAPLARLRYLATAEEAYGAFRLPVPPESGYMPGVMVKSEPFVTPTDELELRERARANQNDIQTESNREAKTKKVSLGTIYHRGNPTAQEFRINIRDLTRHTLIAGSTGSGKSTTIKHILNQLWLRYKIPFLVLYPLDKTDYRELRGFPTIAEDLLVFTLGDETTSPFRFNPFEVPDGVLLKTHLSRLMRVFMAAFTLSDPLPMIYRDALRSAYREKGWNTVTERGGPGREYPIMSEFHQAISKITENLKYGREVQDNVRQASVIRIADLLENAGHVVNVRQSMPLNTILNHPTIMEIGRVGSSQDTSLLMGFLLMRFAEEVERNPRPADLPHITVVEEAHRLMAETSPNLSGVNDSRGAAGEDFANILAEVRGYGEGIIIAEQIPTLLVKGAIGNTYIKIMHWLEDAPSFDLFSNVMNLNLSQREYVRSLGQGYAVVRNPYGKPVHIKVPEFGDQEGFDKIASQDISDESIRKFMAAQRERYEIGDRQVVEWDTSLAASTATRGTPQKSSGSQTWRAPIDTLAWLMAAPMLACSTCRALHQLDKCQYGATIRAHVMKSAEFNNARQIELEELLTVENRDERWEKLKPVLNSIESRLSLVSSADRRGMAYCYLAHILDDILRASRLRADYSRRRRNASNLLLLIDQLYVAAG
jgi:hypothetical protein